MKLSSLIEPSCIIVPTSGGDKFEIITELVDKLDAEGKLLDRDAVLKAVLAREEVRSTGIGHGLAVPHAKCDACSKLALAIGKPANPVDFQSSDAKPCELVLLLASSPSETALHIQTLARISRLWLCNPFHTAIHLAQTGDEVYQAIVKHE